MDTRGPGVPRHDPIHRSVARRVVAALATSVLALGLTGATQAPASAVQVENLAMVKALAAADTYEERVQRLINNRRASHDLKRLRFVTCADGTAERWSRHLAENQLFLHQSMTVVLDRCDAVYAGETLGRGTMGPRKLVRMWMKSPGHRAVLLSKKSRRIGIGATRDSDDRWVVAANFVRL